MWHMNDLGWGWWLLMSVGMVAFWGLVAYAVYWFARSALPVPGGPITWSTEGAPPSPYLRTEGLVSAKCITEGPRGYLWVRTNHNPGDKRTDRVGGEVGLFGMFLPGWGMHLSDMAEAQGDLIRQVGDIAMAEATARSRTAPQPAR